jgi:hypothetical protein
MKEAGHLTFKSLRDWLPEYTKPAWLIRNFLMRDALDVFGGAEKSLKSWLMHHCAIAVAAGVPLFMDDAHSVPTTGRVLLLTGEGGVDLVQDRIAHLCHGMYKIDVDQVLDQIIATADIAPMTSQWFKEDVASAVALHDPVLIQLDPLYVYFGEDREAGNVYSTGPAIMGLRKLAIGRALQVAHHFTKAGADKLTLASLTQAGMREAVDHWLLIAVSEFDLAQQRFSLRLERGARRGFAWSKSADIVLGPFNPDTLRHTGVPSVTLSSVSGSTKASSAAVARAAVEAVKAEAMTLGETFTGVSGRWIREHIDVKAGGEKKLAAIEDAVLKGALRTEPGKRNAILHFYVKDFPA